LVTNIRVAGDAREHFRRNEEEEAFRLRKERLEQESKAASEKFEEIIKKWETAQTKDIPQELHEMLMDQKQLCDSMIDEKNKLINDFELDLKQKDDLYVKTLKKNAEDIDLLIERMKEQIRNMRKFFFEEMVNVENTFINERKELIDKFRKEWEERMNERREKEIKFLEARFKRVETNEKELHEIRVRDAEEYNEKKVKLETDVQILEQQLQQMKATYQLNQEKLEYNYRVLQKRDEENAKTKAQQKRKITKLQDLRTNLKNKLAKQIVEFNDENQSLSNDYKRVTDMFTDLQHKSKHFLTVDLNKFHDIWIMNEEKCKELASKLLNADKIIHEQQLGLKWLPNDLSFLNNTGPINLKSKMKSGNEFASELLAEQDEDNEEEEEEEQEVEYNDDDHNGNNDTNGYEVNINTSYNKTDNNLKQELSKIRNENRDVVLNLSKATLRKILILICDESEFLVEQKLSSLLKPLEKNEQSMIKIDSIFKALNIETENDVKLLAQYFINYNQYNQLIKHNSFILKKNRRTKLEYKESGVGPSSESSIDMAKLAQSVDNLNINDNNDDDDDDGANSHNELKETKIVPNDKCDLIHSNEVLYAMKTFVSIHKKIQK
jgi:dynein regulatry complex protein 1